MRLTLHGTFESVFGRPQRAYAMPRLAFMAAVGISPGVLAGIGKLQESLYEATFHQQCRRAVEVRGDMI
jgi:hypothetical protein